MTIHARANTLDTLDNTRPSRIAQLLQRARSSHGRSIIYELGCGGTEPTAATPADRANKCDCSGFVCWTLGTSRRTTQTSYVHFNDGWINTDAIVNDVRTTCHLFVPIITPKVGCIVVYPHDVALGRHYGHVGVVTAIDEDKVARVIHCSHTNYVKTLDAIQDTPPWVGGFLCAAAIYATYIGDRVPSALVSAAALRG